MAAGSPTYLHYKRSHFATQLPVNYLYSPSHAWLEPREDGSWRVGITRFASRMLGEMVARGFEVEPDSPVKPGQIVGWLEGFKAISDIYCVVDGKFLGGNPALSERIALINKETYTGGWIYAVEGTPDATILDVHGYRAVLDKTIDKIMEKQSAESTAPRTE